MAIKTILMPIRGDGEGEFVLSHAHALARRHNAHITAVHCRARPEDMLPFGVMLTSGVRKAIAEQASTLANEEESRLKALFDQYCKASKLKVVDAPSPRARSVTASWRERTGKQAAVVGVEGRLVDVVAVARPRRDRSLGVNTLEAALFETGRPVLMCPSKIAGPVGKRIAVAWNGSTEAAHAVAMSLDLLKEADTVTILAGAPGDAGRPGAEGLKAYLAAHAIKATAVEVKHRGREIGKGLLDAVKTDGADCLVMGAYGQRWRRELVMGGVTQHVIENAAVPVLFAH